MINGLHLLWIVPVCLFIGFWISLDVMIYKTDKMTKALQEELLKEIEYERGNDQ